MRRRIAGERRKEQSPSLREGVLLFAKGVAEESEIDPSDTWDEGWNDALSHVVEMAYRHPLRWMEVK